MTDAKPLSAEERERIKTNVKRMMLVDATIGLEDWMCTMAIDLDCAMRDLDTKDATIRRRDELIRWLNGRFPVNFIATNNQRQNYITGWAPDATDIKNARDVLAIVEAGDE